MKTHVVKVFRHTSWMYFDHVVHAVPRTLFRSLCGVNAGAWNGWGLAPGQTLRIDIETAPVHAISGRVGLPHRVCKRCLGKVNRYESKRDV